MNQINAVWRQLNPEFVSSYISEGIRNSESYKKRVELSLIRKSIRDSKKDKRYCGSHNSQYNTFWITNGLINKKWKLEKGDIPESFYKGRVMTGKS